MQGQSITTCLTWAPGLELVSLKAHRKHTVQLGRLEKAQSHLNLHLAQDPLLKPDGQRDCACKVSSSTVRQCGLARPPLTGTTQARLPLGIAQSHQAVATASGL